MTTFGRPIGVYEKALPPGAWTEVLSAARDAGYDFVEISVDESGDRLARLDWSRAERQALTNAVAETGIRVPSMCLSGHRRFGLGSADPEVRRLAADILAKAIRLADAVGIRIVQVAGYFAYYETPDPAARGRYLDALARGADLARRYGVMLGLENIDTTDVGSVRDAVRVQDEIGSPWLRIYPDVGNLAVHGLDAVDEIEQIAGHAVALHLKDARAGQPRRVAFGAGTVPFEAVFATLRRIGYHGPFLVEMWNDDPATASRLAGEAREWITTAMANATQGTKEAAWISTS